MTSRSDNSRRSAGTAKSRKHPVRRLLQFLDKDIWEYAISEDRSLKGQGVALLRVLSISWKGLFENRLFSRAAALSYSSLLALGPLIAVVVVLSGSFIKSEPETQIKQALLFIAPSLREMVTLENNGASKGPDAEMTTAIDTLIKGITDGAEQIIGRINTGGSKAFGALGGLILIWVIIQLLTSIETTLNQIWGVHQGRPWIQRIVFYWTFVSLGALLGLGSTALVSASNIAGMVQWVPFGLEMTELILGFTPIISFAMLVLLLVLFYRFFPNTSVALKPAMVGGLLTAFLLFLNNYLSILYVHRVLTIQSLYGSMGILPVLMIGLYFFWVLILLGGQLTYSVQNVSFLANQTAWKSISPRVRELAALSAFLQIARKFHECSAAPTILEMSSHLHIPVNILNESLETLESMDWIISVRADGKVNENESTGYRPSKPLENYNFSLFKETLEQFGQSDMATHLVRQDPILKDYLQHIKAHENESFCQKNLKELMTN